MASQVIVDTTSGILSPALEANIRDAGKKLALTELPVFTYLANTMRVGDRSVPYSLVAATDLARRTSHVRRRTSARQHARPSS